MNKEYTTNLEEIATCGFEAIDPDEMVEVNLKDLMYVFSTLQEYQRFFHQPLHYQSIEDVRKFLGSVDDRAGFKLLHTAIYRDDVPRTIAMGFNQGRYRIKQSPLVRRRSKAGCQEWYSPTDVYTSCCAQRINA